MNGFEQPSNAQRRVPWKPIAVIVGATLVAVVLIIAARQFVQWRQQQALQDHAFALLEADLSRALQHCEDAKNPEACEQDLVAQQATSTGLAELCDELEGDARDQCIWGVARQQNDPEECGTIENATTQQACEDNVLYRLGKEQLSQETCEEIFDETLRHGCLQYVASVIAEKQGCEVAGIDPSYCDAEYRLAQVLALKDPELCQTIPDEDLAAECQEGIGPGDPDLDGLLTPQEEDLGTDPHSADTDADGLSDLDEVETWATDPLNPDTDGDGYLDGAEVASGYSPHGPGALE